MRIEHENQGDSIFILYFKYLIFWLLRIENIKKIELGELEKKDGWLKSFSENFSLILESFLELFESSYNRRKSHFYPLDYSHRILRSSWSAK